MSAGLAGAASRALRIAAPLGYHEAIGLVADARLVLTDSGGLQEETTALGVPCLTLRNTTERPVTVEQGTNTVVGVDPDRIVAEALRALEGTSKAGRVPELWDGHTAERVVDALIDAGMAEERVIALEPLAAANP
jgi:UDP-N-acetylglucosamine 2-epimerase (non-hydrolysing)